MMAYAGVPPPRTVAVELIGGPLCGTHVVAPVGPDALPPPVLPTMPAGSPPDGCYVRAERQARAHSGALQPAYTWQAG